jgi:hypothetical protein
VELISYGPQNTMFFFLHRQSQLEIIKLPAICNAIPAFQCYLNIRRTRPMQHRLNYRYFSLPPNEDEDYWLEDEG